MAHPVLSLLTLVGMSCQLRLAWRSIDYETPDYSMAIEGLGAASVHIEELIKASRHASPATLLELNQAKDLVEQAAELLLDNLREVHVLPVD